MSNATSTDAAAGTAAAGPSGIGGWLILPLLGLTLVVLIQVYGLTGLSNAIAMAMGFGGAQTGVLAFHLIGNLILQLALPAALLVLAFRRRRIFPKAYIAFTIADAVFVCLDFALVRWAFPQSPGPDVSGLPPNIARIFEQPFLTPEMVGAFQGPILGLCIWLPYMLVSRRVKNTFIN